MDKYEKELRCWFNNEILPAINTPVCPSCAAALAAKEKAEEAMRIAQFDNGVVIPELQEMVKRLEAEVERLREAAEWACSKEAMTQSLRLPKGSSPMNGPERITAEICIENLQVGLRRRAGKGEG